MLVQSRMSVEKQNKETQAPIVVLFYRTLYQIKSRRCWCAVLALSTTFTLTLTFVRRLGGCPYASASFTLSFMPFVLLFLLPFTAFVSIFTSGG